MTTTKPIWKSTTFWINFLSFIILWLSSSGDVATTVIGSSILYVLNIILNALKNNTPIKPVIDLTAYGISMKALIYFINIAGLIVSAYQYFIDHAHLNPALWLTMVISLLTAAIRILTTQEGR